MRKNTCNGGRSCYRKVKIKQNINTQQEVIDMMNDKMAMAMAKAVGKEVEIKTAEQDGKNIIVTAVAGDETYKAVLSERKNQYGTYYRVMSSEVVEVADEEPKEDVDEVEAMANLEAAKKFSEQKNAPVYVMSNGKRTAVIKTDSNKARHEKYGYWVAAIFENGVQVSA